MPETSDVRRLQNKRAEGRRTKCGVRARGRGLHLIPKETTAKAGGPFPTVQGWGRAETGPSGDLLPQLYAQHLR